MTKAEKVIERINRTLDKALGDLKAEYAAAENDYYGTGFERCYKKMARLDDDIRALEPYRNIRLVLAQSQRATAKQRTIRRTFLSALPEIEKDYPGDRQAKMIIDKCREAYARAEMEGMDI